MQISCILVDDEPLALDQLGEFVSRIPYLDLKAKFKKGFDAMRYLNENSVDLVFLDIQMDDISGIQIIKALKEKPYIILTTAYDQYAIEGYELDVTDYLLKPISFERLVKAVEKVYNLKLAESKSSDVGISNDNQSRFIFVKADYRLQKINLDDILYIEGYKDYLRFYLTQKRKTMSLMSFKNLEETLPSDEFFRVHKSFIVAIGKIDSIGKNALTIGENQIPIGDFYKETFFNFLKEKNLLK